MNVSSATRVVLYAGVLLGMGACERDDSAAQAEPGEARGAQGRSAPEPAGREDGGEQPVRSRLEELESATEDLAERAQRLAAEAEVRARRVSQDMDRRAQAATRQVAQQLEEAARVARESLDRLERPTAEQDSGQGPEAPQPQGEPQSVGDAVSATDARLRDCDLEGTYYFFFEPGSAALRSADFQRARQLNLCLGRAADRVPEVVVLGRGELGTDLQTGVSLALSRAHNVAQVVAMDGAAREGVTLRTGTSEAAPQEDSAWGRRVEVRLGPHQRRTDRGD